MTSAICCEKHPNDDCGRLKAEMRLVPSLSTALFISAVLASAVFCASAQEESVKEAPSKGLSPRAAPTEYQAHGQAGMVTIGAEFTGHSVPTTEHTFSAEEYVVVEAGLFGSAGAHTKLSRDDFSLRINGKKNVLPSEPYELVFKSLKDPEWQPPAASEEPKASKGGLTTGGGGGGQDTAPPPPPKMPFPLRRAMEQQVQKAAMLEGDRPLPQAGLLFFLYRGKVDGIKSLELIYNGAAGKATLTLQP
jgi:hypothetical protein